MKLSTMLPLVDPLYRFCKAYAERYAGEANGDMRTNGELHFLKEHIHACSTVFDVGANKGEWTEIALSLNPSLSVHCFEPIRHVFAQLQTKPFPANVRRNNCGLSSKACEMSVYLGVQSVYARTGFMTRRGMGSAGEPEKARFVTLDDYCADNKVERIDLLKCDVEGHEYSVLQGAQQMLSTGKIRMVQFEYGGCNIDARVMLKDIFGLLAGHGQSLYKLMPRRMVAVPEYDQRLENFAYKNFVSIRRAAL